MGIGDKGEEEEAAEEKVAALLTVVPPGCAFISKPLSQYFPLREREKESEFLLKKIARGRFLFQGYSLFPTSGSVESLS